MVLNSKQFIKNITDLINKYLNDINQLIKQGTIKISGEYSYNNILRITESETHFICELCGSKKYNPNQAISIKAPNKPEQLRGDTTSYFSSKSNINNEDAMFKISSTENILSGLAFGLLATEDDFNLITKKINLPIQKPKIIGNTEKFKIPIAITPEADYLLFNDIEILEMDGACVHYKIIPSIFVIKKPVNEDKLKESFNYLTTTSLSLLQHSNKITGINAGLNSSIEHFADQLFSLSMQKVKEVVIDNFIQEHADYFAKALGYKKALSQKRLKWIEKSEKDPDESIPDFLMEREDGYYDILDIKKGAIKYNSITQSKKSGKNGRIRVRFIDYASELVAQLKDYERYFLSKDNSEHAYKEHGIKIKNLKLIGIIGNYNNFNRSDVDLSLDKENVIFVSYNEIRNLLKKLPNHRQSSLE
jgi:hypothetical protein